MKLKNIAYTGVVALSLASLVLFTAQAESEKDKNKGGDKQFKEAQAIGSTLELHITDNGKVLVRGAKVVSVSGSTINAAITWGSAVFNLAIVADSSTEFIRRYGGASSVSEISAGDFISFQGALDTLVANPITVKAKIVKDWSIQKAHATFYGIVKSVDVAAKSFVLASEDRGDISVTVSDSTKIKKGSGIGSFADIAAGAKLTVAGLFNNVSKVLEADEIKIHQATALRTTLEGKIKSIGGTTAPATLIVRSNSLDMRGNNQDNFKDYTVNISIDTSVLNNAWLRVALSSFKVGDKIRVYGTVNADMTVDATVVRDTSI